MEWRARLIEGALVARGSKRKYGSAEATEEQIAEQLLRPRRYAPPRWAVRGVDVTVRHDGTMPVYTVAPTSGPPTARALYFHGGGYAFEIDPAHWVLVARLVRATGASIDVPIYPLAPISTAAATVPLAADLVAALVAGAAGRPTTVMGDSAGGGLSLASCQTVRDRGATQPDRIALISPWLDVTVSDPRQAEIDAVDRMLGIAGAETCGRVYAGDLDLRDARVSPLFGDVAGVAPIDVFTGTFDILYPDADRLVDRCRDAGHPVRMHEAPQMQHVYPLFPVVREAAAARAELADIVAGRAPVGDAG